MSNLTEEDYNRYLNEFNNFIAQYKLPYKSPEKKTHITVGGPQSASYNIPDDKVKVFLDLYTKVIDLDCFHEDGESMMESSFGEYPIDVSPLTIDIDLRFDNTHSKRVYTDDTIWSVVNGVNSVIRKYYKLESKCLYAFVMEKKNPTYDEKNDQYKDGFHIMYPYLPLELKARYLITNEASTKCKEQFGKIPYINDYEKSVFDSGVVQSNCWIMYGSHKMDKKPYYYYYLTRIWDHKKNEIDISQYKSMTDLPSFLSNHKFLFTNYKLPKIKPEKESELELKLEQIRKKQSKNKRKRNVISGKTVDGYRITNEEYTLKDIKLAIKLVSLLNPNRSNTYGDWISVGWALHNISLDLLDVWKDFSKISPKYEEGECDVIWERARDDGFQIGSLHAWAREDNPTKYKELMLENIESFYYDAEYGTDYDLAKVIHEKYKHQYKCTSKKNPAIWYEYQGHRWVEAEDAYTLSIKISEEVSDDFAVIASNLLMESNQLRGTEAERLRERSTRFLNMYKKLKNSTTKNKVISECANLFMDKGFEDELDSNRDLIGFNNGVCDLRLASEGKACFRSGCPDDKISFSVRYDYPKKIDPMGIKFVEDFFASVQPEPEMNKFTMRLLSSFLDGHVNEHFYIWTGCGCFDPNTEIMMADGSTKYAKDIWLDDRIMGDDNTVRKVKHVFNGTDKMYRIHNTTSSEYYDVNSEHRLVLKFVGNEQIVEEASKGRYQAIYYYFSDELGIKKCKKYFPYNNTNKSRVYVKACEFIEIAKIKEDYISHNHSIVVKVNKYLTFDEHIKYLLHGCKESKTYPINVEYIGKGEYIGFELDGNKKFKLKDGTITANSNGKSKTLEFFEKAFGDYYAVVSHTLLTRKQGGAGQATPEMAQLRGRRCVVLQEPEDTDRINVGRMKEITGNDWLYARPLFKPPFRFKPQFAPILTCNELPNIPSDDGGTWRRLLVSPWETEFVDLDKNGNHRKTHKTLYPNQKPKDYELQDKMDKYYPELMYLLLTKYYPAYKKEGLEEPAKVRQYTDQYRKDSDVIHEYVQERLDKTDNHDDYESIGGLYTDFRSWFNNSCGGSAPNKKKMGKYFRESKDYIYRDKKLYGYTFKSDEMSFMT